MANIKSAVKRAKIAAVRTERNRMVKSGLRTAVRKFSESLTGNLPEAEAKLRAAISTLDKAATKGVIHKKTASRKAGRLAKKLAALKSAAQA